MGAKKKSKKKNKKNKKKEPEVVEDTTWDNVALHSLTAKFKETFEKLEQERGQRNYYQLQRDAYQTFYSIVKQDIRDLDLQIAQMDREKEDKMDGWRKQLKAYESKVKYQENNHGNDKERAQREGEFLLNEERDEQNSLSKNLRSGKLQLKLQLKEMELSNQQEIKERKKQHTRALDMMRVEFEEKLGSLKERYKEKLSSLEAELELRRKVEIHEIEERKNQHINELYAHHSHAYGQMKDYYNSITRNNLELIKSLKDARQQMKEKQVQDTEAMLRMDQTNKELSVPLAKTTKQKNDLIHELKGYAKDKLSLKNATARLKLLQLRHKQLQEKHDSMQRRYRDAERERDEIYANFESAIWQVQKKSQFKNHMLEQKLDKLSQDAATKQAQLSEVMKYANLDPARTEVLAKISKSVGGHNDAIRNLQYEVAKATKSHNDVVRTMKERLLELGVPKEDLAQAKLIPSQTTSAPASLVASTVF